MILRRLAGLLLALALAACAPRPQPAHPALWQVEGPGGGKAWLFGTIHSLARPALWRSATIDRALDQADTLVVEVADLDDAATSRTFDSLAHSPGLPPLSDRVRPDLRGKLTALLQEAGTNEREFSGIETWAAALMLARADDGNLKSKYGIDRALLKTVHGKRVVELEGAKKQLGLFDHLSEQDQRDLLDAVVEDSGSTDEDSGALAAAWRKGDMRSIEQATHHGILADPDLRKVLFTRRNRAWSARIGALIARGARPFVAVGAAHMAGPEGLPALLAVKGYKVTRVQ